MNSFQEFDCIISEERIGFPIQPFYQNNYSSFQLNSQSLIDFQEGEKSRNEINEAEFHKLIKKQINDLVYKDQEIGYHILLIGCLFYS